MTIATRMGVIDVVAAAQVARNVYKAFEAIKPDCKNTIGDFKENVLRSMHGDYPPEDLARMLSYIQEAVGNIEYNDCSYSAVAYRSIYNRWIGVICLPFKWARRWAKFSEPCAMLSQLESVTVHSRSSKKLMSHM